VALREYARPPTREIAQAARELADVAKKGFRIG